MDSSELRNHTTLVLGDEGDEGCHHGDELRARDTIPPTFDADDLRLQDTLVPEDDPSDLIERPTPAGDGKHAGPAGTSTPGDRRSPPTAEGQGSRLAVRGALAPGARIGHYQLIRALGRGGMGRVFLARDDRLGRLVAMKFLDVQSPVRTERFVAEARATARCSHDNIVVLYEADEHRGRPFMVLEYLRGRTLGQLMDEHRARPQWRVEERATLLPVPRVVEIALPIVRALEYAHAMGIVHRDLKPANVMLTSDGVVKVLDFGIATPLTERAPIDTDSATRAASSDEAKRAPKGLMGTLPYMSPEQLNAEPVDGRTDLWSLGILLFEMLTGHHPLHPISSGKLYQVADLGRPMPRLADIRPDLGPIASLVDRCLSKLVAERASSASALRTELEALGSRSSGYVGGGGGESPFPGLRAFQELDAERFFGRDADIATAIARVRSQPLVALIGPTGVGKSSLVQAGVIPALARAGEGWESHAIRPGATPMATLSGLLERLESQLTRFPESPGPSGRSATVELEDRLAVEPGSLGAIMRGWAERRRRRLLLFVDRFEELFTLGQSDAERSGFLACLAGAADDASSPVRVVIAMRSDFLPHLAGHRSFMAALASGMLFLTDLDRDGLRAAVTGPLAATGYSFETPAILEDILDRLADTRGALPRLQFAASRLWASRNRQDKLLSVASYQRFGDIADALPRHADSVLASLSPSQMQLARAIFDRLVSPERTRVPARLSDLDQLACAAERSRVLEVLNALVEGRLLVVDIDDRGLASAATVVGPEDTGSVELVQESLIDTWPTLRRWLDENREDASFLAQLRAAARAWDRSGRSADNLWRGRTACAAGAWRERSSRPLPEREHAYLEAVAGRERRLRQVKRWAVMAAVAIPVIVAVALVLALTRMRHTDAPTALPEAEAPQQSERCPPSPSEE